MRILVIGTGQVGTATEAEARAHAGVDDVVVASRRPDAALRLDLTAPATMEAVIDAVRPTHVFLAAAATNVAWCEANEDESYRVNVAGTADVVDVCARIDATLIFFSSDYVFDGSRGPYAEDAEAQPINVYGEHKLKAETIVLAGARRNIVIRTCQVFGPDSRRANFVLRTIDTLRIGRELQAPTDLYGTPTYTADVARIAITLALGDHAGIWHVAGPTFLSRYDLALRIADRFSLERSLIVPIQADQLRDGVRRPRKAGLVSMRVATIPQCQLGSLDDSMTALANHEASP